jgi:hypothetical protein
MYLYCRSLIFKEFKYENAIKMKNKLDPALVQISSNKIKKGHQNLVRLSLTVGIAEPEPEGTA